MIDLTAEGVPANDSTMEASLCGDIPCPKCPKCYSTTIQRTIWDKFKAKKIIQCTVCKFYWAL